MKPTPTENETHESSEHETHETHEVVTRSGKIICFRELTGLEQANADRIAREPITMMTYRVAASIVSINGETLQRVTSDLHLVTRLKRLSGSDVDALMKAYVTAFTLTEGELGNGSAAVA